MFQRRHHVAHRCSDAAETVDFHTNVIRLKFSHAIDQDWAPSTQAFSPHLHIFFERADGGYLAFFALANAPPALEVVDEAAPDRARHRCRRPDGPRLPQIELFLRPEREPNGNDHAHRNGGQFAKAAPAILTAWEEGRRTGALAE